MTYRAFISYSHQDSKWASDLQKFLENFRVPRALAANFDGKRPLRPVFRDQTELTSGKLSDAITDALASSDALIVLCSPSAARSKWVGAEIETFREIHDETRIFPLIVGGSPHAEDPEQECFPGVLRDDAEFLAANAIGAAGKRDAFLRIAAALLDVGFDELKQRDQNRRQMIFAGAAIGATTIAAITSVLAVYAYLAQQEAELRRGQADDLIGFMVGDLRSKLEPIGRVDVLDDVGDQAMAYFSSLPEEGEAPVLEKRAMTLRQIGEVRVTQGRFDDGLEAFQEALGIYTSLDSSNDLQPDRLYQRALTHFWMADAHLRRLDHEAAEAEITAYRDASSQLVGMAPGNNEYWLELASAETNLGTLAYRRSQFSAARERFLAAEQAAREIVAREPDNEMFRSMLGGTISWLGSAEIGLGNLERGTELHREMVEMGRTSNANTTDMREKQYFATDLQVLSVGLHNFGQFDEAIAVDDEALSILEELVRYDPENQRWARGFARGKSIAARHRMTACRLDDVDEMLSSAHTELERLVQIDPANAATRVDIANNDIDRARFAAARGRQDESIALAIEGNGKLLTLLSERNDDVLIRRGVARSVAVIAATHHLAGRLEEARKSLEQALAQFDAMNSDDAEVLGWVRIIKSITEDPENHVTPESGRYRRLIPDC